MTKHRTTTAVVFLTLSLMAFSCTGCQIHRVFYSPANPPVDQSWFERDIILAADFIQERQPPTPADCL